MCLKDLYDDICTELADKMHSEHNSAVKLSYYAQIFRTSEEKMKSILQNNPQLTEVHPGLWTRKKYAKN